MYLQHIWLAWHEKLPYGMLLRLACTFKVEKIRYGMLLRLACAYKVEKLPYGMWLRRACAYKVEKLRYGMWLRWACAYKVWLVFRACINCLLGCGKTTKFCTCPLTSKLTEFTCLNINWLLHTKKHKWVSLTRGFLFSHLQGLHLPKMWLWTEEWI